jgi:transposase-like protein
MSNYSADRKEAILSKLLPPHNKSVRSVATEEGMVQQTLYSWRKQAREQGQPLRGSFTICTCLKIFLAER